MGHCQFDSSLQKHHMGHNQLLHGTPTMPILHFHSNYNQQKWTLTIINTIMEFAKYVEHKLPSELSDQHPWIPKTRINNARYDKWTPLAFHLSPIAQQTTYVGGGSGSGLQNHPFRDDLEPLSDSNMSSTNMCPILHKEWITSQRS